MNVKDFAKSQMQNACEYLKNQNPKYDWVGIYVLEHGKLKLEAFVGEKTEHVEINLGDGLCSLAVIKNDIVNEYDVKSNPKYLACFASTQSEIVVPIRFNGKAIGEIDIDSDQKAAFGNEDEKFLSQIADLIAPIVYQFYME
ncbi:GAF domain-containing protein [Thermoplasma sp.]|uniref:GAF domain-containing protein n=1 Tax=Thermoplasma sp. TaxID=1973142 RepID=UPI0026148213|nr:GAF domain-containing protein [Thermoplasma sp.]